MIDEERREQVKAAVKQFAERMDKKLCTVCGDPITKYEQVGRCVYGDPCGHRQWQGRAPEE